MKWIRSKTFAVVTASLGIAALLGGSLGVVTAGVRNTNLSTGFNLVGGPLGGPVAPDQFIACLPSTSWSSVYIWDGAAQTWQHYFNTAVDSVPAYVNTSSAGGIVNIPQFSGVVIIMKTAVSSPRLKDSNNESCG
ncbi:MAG: hypothetical protein ACKVT1_18635 [Dehalococcoidia bacterium]